MKKRGQRMERFRESLRGRQQEASEKVGRPVRAGKAIREIILKARQAGISPGIRRNRDIID